MKKTKTQKGITLIALIITIVVLMILAVVAIGVVQDSGIITHAQDAADKYDTGKTTEEVMIGDYDNEISKYYSINESGNPVVDGKTLNTNKSDFAEALALTSNLYNKKITYISDSSTIIVSLDRGTTFDSFSVIKVRYIDEQGNVSKYAICDSENHWSLEDHKDSSGGYSYIPNGEWAKPSGEKYTNYDGYEADIYEPVTEIPVFEGEWQIDPANTTEEGLTYLSKVLVDL